MKVWGLKVRGAVVLHRFRGLRVLSRLKGSLRR